MYYDLYFYTLTYLDCAQVTRKADWGFPHSWGVGKMELVICFHTDASYKLLHLYQTV